MRIICDSNIIIDFSKIHRLDLLKELFNEIVISNEVKEELLVGGKNGTTNIEDSIDEWIRVERIKMIKSVGRHQLDKR